MKFIPTKKESWIQTTRQEEAYRGLSDGELSRIYDLMVKEANQGMIAAAALGGKWDETGFPDLTIKKEDDGKKNNILDAPTELMVNVFKILYAEYEQKVRRMFIDPATIEISITPKQVVEVLHSVGLEEYATQVYILFGGLFLGCKDRIGQVIPEVNGLVAAYKLADELEVDVNEIDPKEALKTIQKRDNHENR